MEKQYTQFLEQILESKKVWALKNQDGWATSFSDEEEDPTGEPLELIPFWASEQGATACAVEDWDIYTPASIELNSFMEDWCEGMANDLFLSGVNWDADMFGPEQDPLYLVLDIIDLAIEKKVELEFTKYKSLLDFKTQVKEVLDKES